MYDMNVSPFLSRDCTTAACVIIFMLGVWVAHLIVSRLFSTDDPKDKTNE